MKYALCDNCERRLYAYETAFKVSGYIFCSSICMQRYLTMTVSEETVELSECFYGEDDAE